MIDYIHDQNGKVSVQLEGNIDVQCAASMREQLIPFAEAGKQTHFLFDFSRVTYIDSAGLGVLVAIYRRISRRDGIIKISEPVKNVERLFELTRLHKVFDIESNASA